MATTLNSCVTLVKNRMKNKGEGLKKVGRPKKVVTAGAMPLEVSNASQQIRRGTLRPLGSLKSGDRFNNIEEGLSPFSHDIQGATSNSSINVRDAVILCQKAYYNIAIFRNTIDLMTEFAATPIYFKSDNAKAKTFFESYGKSVGLNSLASKFFREYFRSGNVFIHKIDGLISRENLNKMVTVYGIQIRAASDLLLPIRFVILNPSEIQAGGNISFVDNVYHKVLSNYELERLRNPRTDEDKLVLNALNPETREKVKNARGGIVSIPLDKNKVYAVFYKKQDYEPLAVPMGFPVLDDLNWKAEMKKIDMIVARTAQQAILLITMGAEPEKGGVNKQHLEAMKTFFATESVARVLIADYTTKAEFVLPDISKFIDPKKYEVVNADIKEGLNNLLIGVDDKFANAQMKIQVFIQRLEQAREAFLDEFLMPEIKRISKELGFKTYPIPYFEEIDFRNELEYAKVYTRLIELGVLTPGEGIDAMNTGRLPTAQESLTAQREFRKQKDDGLYEPIVGGRLTKEDKENELQLQKQEQKIKQSAGRPGGTGKPFSKTKKVTPIGADEKYGVIKITESLKLADEIKANVKAALRKKHKIKKLNDEQLGFAEELTEIIITNEDIKDWKDSVAAYVENPNKQNLEYFSQVLDVAESHQLPLYLAGVLFASKA